MEKRTREIIALVLLLAMGLAVAGAMAWYILIGHGWNQAATHIDDMVGSMDGYTVVVFDGVVKKPKQHEPTSESSATSSSAASSGPLPTSESSATSSSSASASPDSPKSSTTKSKKKKVTAAKVAAQYKEKGASTLVVDMKHLYLYSDPCILKRGSKRIGVFSSSGPYRMHMTSIRAKIRYLQEHKVDFIIVLADDRSMLTERIDGANLLLLAKGGGLPGRGGLRGYMFCVDSPYKGEVQSVIISPSNVLTSQTIKEL